MFTNIYFSEKNRQMLLLREVTSLEKFVSSLKESILPVILQLVHIDAKKL